MKLVGEMSPQHNDGRSYTNVVKHLKYSADFIIPAYGKIMARSAKSTKYSSSWLVNAPNPKR